MNEREWRDRIKRALRNARRAYRSMDTQGEKIERWMDRMIERKTLIRWEQAEPVAPMWDEYKRRVAAAEKALSDFLGIAGA